MLEAQYELQGNSVGLVMSPSTWETVPTVTTAEDRGKGSKLSKEDLNELREVWERDHCMPDIEWRKAWATSHGLSGFANVTSFFRRKEKQASRVEVATQRASKDSVSQVLQEQNQRQSRVKHPTHAGLSDTTRPTSPLHLLHRMTNLSAEYQPVSPPVDVRRAEEPVPSSILQAKQNVAEDRFFVPRSIATTPSSYEAMLYEQSPDILLAQAYETRFLPLSMHETSLEAYMPSLCYSPANSSVSISQADDTPHTLLEPLYLLEPADMRGSESVSDRSMLLETAPRDVETASWMKLDSALSNDRVSLDGPPSDTLWRDEQYDQRTEDWSSYNVPLTDLGALPEADFFASPLTSIGPLDHTSQVQAVDGPLSSVVPFEGWYDAYMPLLDSSVAEPQPNESTLYEEAADYVPPKAPEDVCAYQPVGHLADVERDIAAQAEHDSHWDQLAEASYQINRSLGLTTS